MKTMSAQRIAELRGIYEDAGTGAASNVLECLGVIESQQKAIEQSNRALFSCERALRNCGAMEGSQAIMAADLAREALKQTEAE